MHEDESIYGALCDEPCADHGLAKGSRCRQNTSIVRKQGFGGEFLLDTQLALKGYV
jgi:hypothetical protein